MRRVAILSRLAVIDGQDDAALQLRMQGRKPWGKSGIPFDPETGRQVGRQFCGDSTQGSI
jgi:hypothetical protein